MKLAKQFIKEVQSGKLLSCRYVELAVQRHLSFYDNPLYYFDEKAANAALNIFGALRHTSGDYGGKPFAILPWQAFIVYSIFGWKVKATKKRLVRKVYCEVAKKNGKTEMAAAIGLIGAIFDGEYGAEVYSAANKFDQASICWKSGAAMAKFLVNDFPEDAANVTIYESFNNRQIKYEPTNTFFKPIASDSKTLDGVRPHFAIIDEYHEAKDDSVLHNLSSGMVNRSQPLLFIITTAGFNINGPCHKYRGVIADILEGKKKDDTTFGIIFTLDEGDNWEDENIWIKANPSIGITPTWEGLRAEYLKALNEGSDAEVNFKTKNLNIWVRSKKPWIQDHIWKRNGTDFDIEELKGRECYGAFDLSSTRDLTAVGYLFPPLEGETAYKFIQKYYCPEDNISSRARKDGVPYLDWVDSGKLIATPGNVTDFEFIENDINEDAQKYQVVSLGYDKWQSEYLAQRLAAAGAPIYAFPQTVTAFNEPIKWLEKAVMRGQIDHGNCEVLRWMIGNVVIQRNATGLMKFDKNKSREKIDGAVVLAMCVGEFLNESLKEDSIYKDRELLFF